MALCTCLSVCVYVALCTCVCVYGASTCLAALQCLVWHVLLECDECLCIGCGEDGGIDKHGGEGQTSLQTNRFDTQCPSKRSPTQYPHACVCVLAALRAELVADAGLTAPPCKCLLLGGCTYITLYALASTEDSMGHV